MNVRDLYNLPQSELQNTVIDGRKVMRVVRNQGGDQPYEVWLGSGDCILAKGHDRVENLKIWKQVSSSYRIRQYGEFGSTIN